MMRAIVSSGIVIGADNDAEDKMLYKWCKDNLVVDNPDYFKKQAMGKWTGNTPQTIALYEQVGNDYRIPFGCLQRLWKLVGKNCQWSVQISPIRPFPYQSNISLYSYQEKAVNEAIRAKNGILVMPCGAGKTQSGLEIVSRIGGRALWLTHTQDLLNQSKGRAESVLGGKYGTITEGKVNIAESITFATVQTMANLDLEKYADVWDVVIVDECQHCCGSPTKVTQFYKVVSRLSARYKFGLTATPKRADGLEKAMFALLGDIIYEVPREAVAETTCQVLVFQAETGWTPDYDCVLMSDGTIDYSKVIMAMTEDEDRFRYVADFVNDLDGSAIVLANRVEYLQRLCKNFKDRGGAGICLSGMGTSKAAKAERKAALQRLNDGEIQRIFATYQLAKEGLDAPNLRYVMFATPEKDETTVTQAVGRVGRKAEGKDFGCVIDLIDNFGMYKGWAKKRAGYYKKIGAEVKEFQEEE